MHREDEVLRRHLGRAFLTRQSNVIHPDDAALPRRHHGLVVLMRYPGATREEEVRARDVGDRVRRTVKTNETVCDENRLLARGSDTTTQRNALTRRSAATQTPWARGSDATARCNAP